MLINRIIRKKIENNLNNEPIITIIYGPRQAGKTTLMNLLSNNLKTDQIKQFNGDDLDVQNALGTPSFDLLKKHVSDCQYLFIDEAQRIPQIGLSLKLIYDNLKIHIMASGSSSFDLINKLSEPLTGRSIIHTLYPLSFSEIPKEAITPTPRLLENYLRFGMYPKVITTVAEEKKITYLYNLINNYLYKDILTFENVRKPKKIIDLLSLLALQIGQEVSIAELAKQLKLSQPIVEKYLDILEKIFVIINLRGFSRNLRKEITKTSKYYFVDLGLRNALIRNFNPLNLRNDTGAMFENWFILEKIKQADNINQPANFYFWRTYDQKEIDLIEDRDGQLVGYECKWSKQKTPQPPKDWLKAYPEAKFIIANPDNFSEFLN